MHKVLVLLSGGIDSTVSLGLAIKKYGKLNVGTISFDYGQTNELELISAKNIANYYGVSNDIINLTNIFQDSNCSLLKDNNIEIPKKTYSEQISNPKKERASTNVPFRNGTMLSVAASYAIAHNYNEIYYGIHLEEGIARDLYPDCDEDFNLAMNLAIYIGSGKSVKIVAPLTGMLKKEIIKIGLELDVPYELTWTCYDNGNVSCGECCACRDRLVGFKENNVKDPLKYKGDL